MALYNGWVSEIARRFQQRFESMRTIYNFDHGDEFEIALAEALREMLPDRFGVCRGFVVERSGRSAGDDLIVYDRARFPTLRFLGEDLARKEQVPVEAVLAYIEAKHTLNLNGEGGQSLRKACEQVAAVRALHRKPVPLNVVAPHIEYMGTMVTPGKGWPTIRNPLYGAVFARNLDVADGVDVREALAEAVGALNDTKLPDVIAAGRAMSLPASITLTAGSAKPDVGIRPFLDVPGNQPIFCQPDATFGLALLHLLSSIEIVLLGTLPWPALINETVSTGADGFIMWSPASGATKTGGE